MYIYFSWTLTCLYNKHFILIAPKIDISNFKNFKFEFSDVHVEFTQALLYIIPNTFPHYLLQLLQNVWHKKEKFESFFCIHF